MKVREPKLSSSRVVILSVLVIVASLVISIGGSYALTLIAISRSQHQWCDTLSLLTANSHPSTSQGKVFYGKLSDLENKFHC